MNVLWVVNVPPPEACTLYSYPPNPFGGWLVQSSELIARTIDNLTIAYPSSTNDTSMLSGEVIDYLPFSISSSGCAQTMIDILNRTDPDLVHIYGTELPHALKMINACKKIGIPFVISIQGMVSVYSNHVYNNVPVHVRYLFTLRNILKRDNLVGIRKIMQDRGKAEVEIIQASKHVIGRTLWDETSVLRINKDVNYYCCNEILRSSFYSKPKWKYEGCNKYSIFISQAHYSIKGFHNVLKAIFLVKKNYPDVKVYVSGKNTQYKNKIKQLTLGTYYDYYIYSLIKDYQLTENIHFTGLLQEKELHDMLLKSHVYICASSIENSPNSLGEAMIKGVPCISSFVGGIPSLCDNEEVLFYQHDAPDMLASRIEQLFSDLNLCNKLSESSIKRASKTHDMNKNNSNLFEIYKKCIE